MLSVGTFSRLIAPSARIFALSYVGAVLAFNRLSFVCLVLCHYEERGGVTGVALNHINKMALCWCTFCRTERDSIRKRNNNSFYVLASLMLLVWYSF